MIGTSASHKSSHKQAKPSVQSHTDLRQSTFDRMLVKAKLTKGELAYIIFCFFVMLAWAWIQKYDYGCDETRRLLVPEYIYAFGKLPNGRDPLVIFQPYGFSYATTYTFLPAILCAICMRIMSIFTVANKALLIAARIPSVIAGTITVYVTIRLSKLLFNKPYTRRVYIALMTLLPEFIFLSSFFNSDIIAICFSQYIIWAMVDLYNNRWTKVAYAKLIVGLTGCMLSYLNTYIWIPTAIAYFIAMGKQSQIESKRLAKDALIIGAICTALVSPFLIRQVTLYGSDLTGDHTGKETAAIYADKDFDLSTYDTSPIKLGYTIQDVITGNVPAKYRVKNWLYKSRESFYGRFGYSSKYMTLNTYRAFRVLYGTGVIVGLAMFTYRLRKKAYSRRRLILLGAFVVAFVLILLLSVYYSIFISFQPQARYTMPVAQFVIAFVAAKGWGYVLEYCNDRRHGWANILSTALVIASLALLINATRTTFIPTAYSPKAEIPNMNMASDDWVQYTHPYKKH